MSYKRIILINCVLTFAVSLSGQCPNQDVLRTRLVYLRSAAKLPAEKELPEVLEFADKIRDCPYKNDSTHVDLLRRIAELYYNQGDYLSGVQYLRQSIAIISSNASKPSVKVKNLVPYYYWLSVYYDSLNNA